MRSPTLPMLLHVMAPLLLVGLLGLPACGDDADPAGGSGGASDAGGEGSDLGGEEGEGEADLGPQDPCGNGQPDEGEVCDDGAINNGRYGYCKSDCSGMGPHCGDGLLLGEHEACDDAELNGSYGHCLADCSAEGPRCGDGELEPEHEACDDGEYNGRYGYCLEDCSAHGPDCGDGVVEQWHEECDDGENNGFYGYCREDCDGMGPFCGDGDVQIAREECDDGPDNGLYGRCNADCTAPAFTWTPYPAEVDDAWLTEPPECTPQDWLAKYMRYRIRLRGDGVGAFPGFVSVGPDPGQSMPASHRDPETNCANDWWLMDSDCPQVDQPDAQGKLSWGDSTIWLGEYIVVLATEYAAFERLGLDTTQTVEDLYYALQAFNRVDEAAEVPYGVPPARDGFFLRDDVPADFFRLPDGGYRFPRNEEGIAGYECIRSAFGCGVLELDGGDYISQDQVMGLMWGLSFVNKLIPDEVTYQGESLRGIGREMVHRMTLHLRSNNWRVTAPDGNHPPDKWGGNAIAFSNQLAKLANVICGTDFGVDDYRDELSRTEGEAVFLGLLAIWEMTHSYNRTMAFRLLAGNNEWDAERMAEKTVADGKDVFALGHAVLNDVAVGPALSTWRLEALLDSAPCGGPCRQTPGCENAPGWMGDHRFVSPYSRMGSKHRSQSEFNGLDYMVLHNLYLLYRHGRYGVTAPEPPAEGCGDFVGLERILDDGVGEGLTYDPQNPCTALDTGRRFCGRSFAGWLDAALRGEATIITAGGRWTCEGNAGCTITPGEQVGTDGVDLILGTPGDDRIDGEPGDDCIYGFGGNDFIEGDLGRDEIHGGLGNDRIFGERDGLVLSGEPDVLYGEDGDDYLKGGPEDDELHGGDGADELIGDSGHDFILCGDGNDRAYGEGGDDSLTGGPGDDLLVGGDGDDTLWAGPGRDRVKGDGGEDWMWGEDGDDFLKGDSGADRLFAGPGHDRLCGNGGDDDLWGNWDGDECLGGGFLGGDDTVNGCEDESVDADDCDDGAFEDW